MIIVGTVGDAAYTSRGLHDQGRPVRFYRYRGLDRDAVIPYADPDVSEKPSDPASFQKRVPVERVAVDSADSANPGATSST